MNNFFKMFSSLKAYAPIFEWREEPVRKEPVREEPVREEPVCEEPVCEEPVRAEEIAVDVSTPKNNCLDLNCSSCGNAFHVQCPPMDMDMDPNIHPLGIFFKNLFKDCVICNQCSCYLAVDLDNDEYNKELQAEQKQAVLRTADEAEGHDEFVIALGGQVTESDDEDECQSSASNQGVSQRAVSYPSPVPQPSVSSAGNFGGKPIQTPIISQAVSGTATSPTPKTQQKFCEYFGTPSGCRFGDKCRNLHIATPSDVLVVRQPMPTRTPVVPQPSANSAAHSSGKPQQQPLCFYHFTQASGCTKRNCPNSHAYRAPEGMCRHGSNCRKGQHCPFFCPPNHSF